MSSPRRHRVDVTVNVFLQEKLRLGVGMFINLYWGHPFSQTNLNLTDPQYAVVERCMSMYQMLRSARSAFASRKRYYGAAMPACL